MKILFILEKNPFFSSSANGNRYSSLIDGLLMNGFDVSLIITDNYLSKDEYKKKGYIRDIENLEISYLFPYLCTSVFYLRIKKYLLSSFFSFLCKIKLKFKIENKDYDLLWLDKSLNTLNFYNKSCSFLKTKSIMELNEFNDIYKLEGTITNKLQKKHAEDLNNALLKAIGKIDYFAIMTNTLINHYQTYTKSTAKMIHLPMTVDFRRFENVEKIEKYKKPYIAFTGTYTNRKDGVDVLIKSFSLITKKYPKYHLYLAGFDHPDMKIQKEIIRKEGLENRVTYLGLLNKKEIPCFIKNSDLLVLSRPDSKQAQGGFPTKLGEYLATGNPVCVTRVGEIEDYLEDNISAFLAEPGSCVSFSRAMERALESKEQAIKVGLRGQKVALENFDINVQAERLAVFLKENIK